MKKIEMKFRVWYAGSFVYLDFAKMNEWQYFGYRTLAHPDAVYQQLTGLKDMDGKEVYDGDVVEHVSEGTYENGDIDRAEVYYDEKYGRFGLKFYSIFGGEGYTGKEQHISDFLVDHKVIGNIYQNSELL